MFPSIVHDAKGPLIRLSCVRGTPPLVISPFLPVFVLWRSSSSSSSTFFFPGVGFFFIQQEVLKVLDAVLQGCGHFESSITHKHKQLPSIFLWIATKKKDEREKKKKNTKRNNSNTHTKKKNLVYWTIHFFQSVDTALTKYSTLRIVHIGRTEEGGKTCGPGFSLASLNRLSLLIPAKKSNPKG